MRKTGAKCVQVDVADHPSKDLTKPRVVEAIVRAIRGGHVRGVMLATPCATFSVARDGSSKIRSHEVPWGLEGLGEKQQIAVEIGNSLARATLTIVAACLATKTPAIVENPRSSRLFALPEIKKLQENCITAKVDQCLFGTKWKKPTTLLCFNVAGNDHVQTCGGKNGICVRTGLQHVVLRGTAPNSRGEKWTSIAQSYPDLFAKFLAEILLLRSLPPDPGEQGLQRA